MEKIPEEKFYNGAVYREYMDRVGALMTRESLSDEDFEQLFKDLKTKTDELKNKYGEEVYRHPLYHSLAHSSFREGEYDLIEEDFPGEDSVIKFVESLEAKYGQK